MPEFGLLGSLMQDLHKEFVHMYYMLLPIAFTLAVVIAWFRSPSGSPEFIQIIKRTVVSTLLLAAFPEISSGILLVADGIAERIDQLNGLDTVMRMAQEKSDTYSTSVTSMIIAFNDLMIAGLSFISFLVLYIARYLTVAMYHFFWTFYMVSAPLLLLFNLFEGTQQITTNLFKGMIEVASWKIAWAILGAMLMALSFGDAYQAEGSYITLIVMNFVIAVAMLMTPMIVSSLVGKGLTSMAPAIGTAAATAMAAAPLKAASLSRTARSYIGGASSNLSNRISDYSQARMMKKNPYLNYTKQKD